MKIISGAGVYRSGNTAQAASVEFGRQADKLCMQQLAKFGGKARKGFFDSFGRRNREIFPIPAVQFMGKLPRIWEQTE